MVALDLTALADKDPFLDRRKDAESRPDVLTSTTEALPPVESRRRRPLQAVSDNIATGIASQVEAGESILAPTKTFKTLEPATVSQQRSVTSTIAAAPVLPQIDKIRKVLRLRDSLPGTYAIDVLDMTNPNGTVTTVVGAKKRKDNPTGGAQGRKGRSSQKRWRASQVEVLDLTGA